MGGARLQRSWGQDRCQQNPPWLGSSTILVSPSHSKNLNNSKSEVVSFRLLVEAQAQVSLNGSVPRGNGALLEVETDLGKYACRVPSTVL